MALRESHAVRKPSPYVLVEADRERLVLGMARFGERLAARLHHPLMREHAAAVVDDQAHRYRHVRVIEERDRLRDAVFEYLEGGLREVGHRVRFSIEDVHV